MLESMLVDVFTRFHSLCILGEISVQDNLAIRPDRSSKVFPLPSFLLHLFHNQVNFLCNSLAARAGVEFYVPWPVRELISDLLHHLERFRCPLHRFKYPTSGPATIPLLWNSLRTQVFTWARSRGRKGTKTSTRLRSITLLNCRPPASLKAPAAISGSSWNGHFLFSAMSKESVLISWQQYLRKGNLFSGFAFPPGWKRMKMFFLCRITVQTFYIYCLKPPVVHTINCFIVIEERFHCIQHPRRHLVNLKYFSLAELLPRSSHLVEYENIVLTCRTIAYDPGAQLVFVVCWIVLEMKSEPFSFTKPGGETSFGKCRVDMKRWTNLMASPRT